MVLAAPQAVHCAPFPLKLLLLGMDRFSDSGYMIVQAFQSCSKPADIHRNLKQVSCPFHYLCFQGIVYLQHAPLFLTSITSSHCVMVVSVTAICIAE